MVEFKNFQDTHIEAAHSLWAQTEWASVSQSDEPDSLHTFLARNPGCSWITESDGQLVGTILAGHDARRGYIYHLVVGDNYQRQGIGKTLLTMALDSLREAGVLKCHAIVIDGNPAATFFWTRYGWQAQETTQYSKFLA